MGRNGLSPRRGVFFPLALWAIPAAAALCAPLPLAAQESRPLVNFLPAPPPAPDAAPATTPAPPAFSRPEAIPPLKGVNAPEEAEKDAEEEEAQAPSPPAEPADPFAPPGLRRGAFTLHPGMEADVVFTDNLDQTEKGRRAAAGLRLAPSLRLKSNWPRHELEIGLKGAFIAWSREGEKEATFSAEMKTRLDIRRGTALRLEATYDLGEEDDPPERLQHDLGLKTTLSHDIGRLRLSATAQAARTFYTRPLGGGAAGSDDDYTTPAGSLRVSWELSPALRPYLEAGGDMRIHDRNRDSAGRKRNSAGAWVEAGAEFAPDGVWSGAIGLRLALRDYDDPAYGTTRGAGVNAELGWRPSRITEIRLKSAFDIDETTASGASGARKYTVSLAPRHALRANLTLKGLLQAEYADYVGISDHELTLTAGGEIAWKFHRGCELVGAYALERQWSTFSGADYLENRITIGLRYRM